MRPAYDFSSLYRSMIGVDRMADLIETAMRRDVDQPYPPYNIEKTGEDAYRIMVAAAGFGPNDLELTAQPNLLVVTGRRQVDDEGRKFLHHGVTVLPFERRFQLADHLVVKHAAYADGVLSIDLTRELPEALKPRRIEIAAADDWPKLKAA